MRLPNQIRILSSSNKKEGNIMSSQAISQELSRVRKLKRALESEIELLRSDMEQGKIHLRVSTDKEFRKALAECMVKISAREYDNSQGWYVADVVAGKIYYCQQGQWKPYPENTIVVDLEDCFNEKSTFCPDVEWENCDLPFYGQLVDEYLENEGESRDHNGDIPEWVDLAEVIIWGIQHSFFSKQLQEIEEEWYDQAFTFALEEIKDEVIVEI